MTIHALAGLPRSGSTLLANVLAQHPDVHTSGTSSLSNVLDVVQGVLSNDPTVISELSANPGMYSHYQAALCGLMNGWYSHVTEPCIIDKGRGWAPLWTLAQDLDPNARLLVTVRDPRDVIASIERQHQATGLFRSPISPVLRETAERLMEPKGMVGSAMRFIEDLIRRRSKGVMFIRHESFIASPEPVLAKITEHLGLDPFSFDVENVESVGGDADEVWRGKYPHQGTGAIRGHSESWEDVLDPELGALIAGVFPLYMSTFSY